MDDCAFTFAHAVFHAVLFFVIHGPLAQQAIKTNRKQRDLQKRNSAMPHRLHTRIIKTAKQ